MIHRYETTLEPEAWPTFIVINVVIEFHVYLGSAETRDTPAYPVTTELESVRVTALHAPGGVVYKRGDSIAWEVLDAACYAIVDEEWDWLVEECCLDSIESERE